MQFKRAAHNVMLQILFVGFSLYSGRNIDDLYKLLLIFYSNI